MPSVTKGSESPDSIGVERKDLSKLNSLLIASTTKLFGSSFRYLKTLQTTPCAEILIHSHGDSLCLIDPANFVIFSARCLFLHAQPLH